MLMHQNKADGFMCVSCAWAKPEKPAVFLDRDALGHPGSPLEVDRCPDAPWAAGGRHTPGRSRSIFR
jgi:hypothetical protein